MSEIISWLTEHSLWFLLAAGTVFCICWLMHFRDELEISPIKVVLFSILHTLYGVLTVKVFAVIETGFDMDSAGSMSLFGAVAFMPAGYFLVSAVTKKKPSKVFDIFTICLLFTLMCARINCIISGCCTGRLIAGTQFHYPTREIEIAFYIVMLVALGRKVLNREGKGAIYPIYMIAYGIFRFIEEWFRTSSDMYMFHKAHIWALLSLIIGLSIYFEIRTKQNKTRRKNKEGTKHV